jgi:poly(3-hydroxybutyrate) depolymerase
MSLTLGASRKHGHTSEAESLGAHDDTRTLPHRGGGGGSGAVGHMVTPEPSLARRWVRCHGACSDDRTLLHQEAGLELWDTWQHQSPSMSSGVLGATGHVVMPELPGTRSGLEPRGHAVTLEPFLAGSGVRRHGTRLKSCTRG